MIARIIEFSARNTFLMLLLVVGITLAMFPVLVVMYVKLARTEEHDARAAFSDAYDAYAAEVPGFFPKLGRIFGRESTGGYRHG